MKKTNFRDWTIEKVDDVFGLIEIFETEWLAPLVSFAYEISDYERKTLRKLQQTYKRRGGEDWNETELANKFISPLIVFSEMDDDHFNYFLERELTLTIGDYELVGKVDGMIATGIRSPKKPYFCLNEYKKGADPNGDPRGQLLIAMLVAQELNQDGKPIYGLYVVGKLWHFVVLIGKKYTISNGFVADTDEIMDIYKTLKGLRHAIEQMIFPPI
jgi:hypothetical protein